MDGVPEHVSNAAGDSVSREKRKAAEDPYAIRASVNKVTGNFATVFYTQQGSYIIVDNVAKTMVQINDNINPLTWMPDLSIVDPYIPN